MPKETFTMAEEPQDQQKRTDCFCCIINDMSAACRPGDESCHLFHRRLAGLLGGARDQAGRFGITLHIDQIGQCEFCAFGPHECIRKKELAGTTGGCWRKK